MKIHFLIKLFISTFLLILFISITIFPFNTSHSSVSFSIPSDSAAYNKIKAQIINQRDSISKVCLGSEDKNCINTAGNFLVQAYYKRIVPQWIGTKWEFYGKTEIPRHKSIACGYFVVHTLKHLGLNLEDPIAMAENYSAYMISTLCDTSYKTTKASDLLAIIRKKPDDVWVVGLSNHSGLLVKYNGRIRFVHSSYIDPVAVTDELAETSPAFLNSKIYIAGNLFIKNSLTDKWLKKEEIKFIKRYPK